MGFGILWHGYVAVLVVFFAFWWMGVCNDALVDLIGGGNVSFALGLKLLGLGNWLQSVQRGLLKQETQTKADKSPVTVADYGAYLTRESFASILL